MLSWADLRREPFRLLFPLGTLFGLIGVGHWLAYTLGWIQSSSGFYHASIQISSFLPCFIFGFLLTALPRFAGTTPASSLELVVVLALFLAQPVLLSLGAWVAAEGCFVALLLALAVFAGRRFASRRSGIGPPTEFVWIPIAILHGLIGAGLLMAGQLHLAPVWVVAVGKPLLQQGFVLGIVLGVGGFMAPRLLGREALPVTPVGVDAETARRIRARRIRWHLAAGAVFFGSFWLEGGGWIRPAYGLRASVITAEFLWTTRCYRPPRLPDGYLRLLWLSLWMIISGFWAVVLAPRLRVAAVHLVFLGGLSLMVFAVGTMVVMSHAGEGARLRQPLWIVKVVGAGVSLAVLLRLGADMMPRHFFPLLGAASLAWLIAAMGWLAFALPRVLRSLPDGEFERLHDEAKQRALRPAEPIRSA